MSRSTFSTSGGPSTRFDLALIRMRNDLHPVHIALQLADNFPDPRGVLLARRPLDEPAHDAHGVEPVAAANPLQLVSERADALEARWGQPLEDGFAVSPAILEEFGDEMENLLIRPNEVGMMPQGVRRDGHDGRGGPAGLGFPPADRLDGFPSSHHRHLEIHQ